MIELVNSKNGQQLALTLRRIRERSVVPDVTLMSEVSAIIQDVQLRGDAALVEYAQRFDGHVMEARELRVKEEELRRLADYADVALHEALEEAITAVRRFHECERQRSWEIEGLNGVRLGQRLSPIECVGLYVPGGSACYPSTVVMNVVPAQMAGVERIVVTTPPRAISNNPALAAALLALGINEVYAVGGAQAIAALAYGTETVPRVDKITGPGNRYVVVAKKLVFGFVGIDSLAGPTEVVIIADETAVPSFVAADLLAQAEHAADAAALMITTSESMAHKVLKEITKQLESLPRREIIQKSLANHGAIIIVDQMNEICEIVNDMAPEHVQIMVRDAAAVASRVRNAGAIFLGNYSPEAVGDYLAGPNHVLPTSRTARFASSLGVYDFMKRTNLVEYSSEELGRTAQKIAVLARAEGLEAHARSALIRTKEN